VLRLTFSPEAIEPESDPGLDEVGFFTLQVFDTPNPPPGDAASKAALYEAVTPLDSPIALSNLPTPTIVLRNPPSTVYVRALFFDNVASGAGGISWGTWFGGVDVSNGFTQNAALTPVPLTRDETTMHDVPLMALRRVTVTVTTSAALVGDGEGSLSVAASRVEVLPPRASTYGYGIKPCVDLKTGPQTVDMQVVGSGTFFVAGFFDDLGIQTPGEMPPGTMLSVRDVHLDTGAATFDRITLAPGQYSGALSIDLGFVTPLPGNTATPGPNSCRDLGLTGDAGP
jgi:hypothetical protein